MKISHLNKLLLIFILGFFFACNTKLIAQNVLFENMRLDSVLLEFSNEHNCTFAYDNELISTYFINQKVKFSDVETSLKKILKPCNLECQLKNGIYIIIPVIKEKIVRNIVGVVKDKDTGETLPFAHVLDPINDIFCITNQDGYFSIMKLDGDSLSIIISYVGYNQSEFNFKLSEINNLKVFYILSQKHEIEEVIIKAENKDESSFQVNEQIGLTTLNTKSITSFPSMGENDALRLIQMMPGIKSSNESSADLIIRGGTMDQNLILFDDFSLYHVDHFYGMVSSLNPKAIKHIQVYKGGFDARYGGRMNSVVNIVGKSGNNVKPSVDFGLNMLSANLAIEFPILKKGAFFIAGRRSYTDFIQTPLFNQMFESVENAELEIYSFADTLDSQQNKKDPDFYFYDINSKLTYNLTEKDNISISYFKSMDNLIRDESIFGSFFTNNDVLKSKGLSFRWGRQWNEKFYTKLLVSKSEFLNDFVSLEDFEFEPGKSITFKIQNTNKLKENTYKLNSEYKFSKNINLDFGYELVKQQINYTLKYSYDDFEETGENIKNEGEIHSAYLQTRIKNMNRFGLTIGVRGNYYDQTDEFYFEPRINISYRLFDGLSLKAAYGKYHQYLAKVFTGNEFSTSKSLWFTSDDIQIPVGKSKQYIAGIQYRKNNFVVDIEYFNKDIEGLVKYIYDFSGINDFDSEIDIYNQGASFFSGESDINGIDVLISKDFGKFNGWISYTLSRNNIKYENLHKGNDFHSINDQRHEFKVAGIKSIKNFKLALSWIYGSGFLYSDPYYSVDAKNNFEQDVRQPDYHKLDLSCTYSYNLSVFKGSVGVSVLNLYNRKNKRLKESVPYVDDNNTYYDLISIDLSGRAISAFFNIKF
ncbi:MAG: TonB-dependent receptor [Bacteroidales bacterium]|nr:TonB-dependent receptor [Bacteroidales bacterium]